MGQVRVRRPCNPPNLLSSFSLVLWVCVCRMYGVLFVTHYFGTPEAWLINSCRETGVSTCVCFYASVVCAPVWWLAVCAPLRRAFALLWCISCVCHYLAAVHPRVVPVRAPLVLCLSVVAAWCTHDTYAHGEAALREVGAGETSSDYAEHCFVALTCSA